MSTTVKKIILILFLFSSSFSVFAQEGTSQNTNTSDRDKKRQQRNVLSRQEEEGVLSYQKQNVFGVALRTNGFGVFVEKGIARTPRFTNLFIAELSEIKHPKEARSGSTESIFGNSFIYGKRNNFYQFKLGFGQQYVFGQKGNKNGIAVLGIAQAGLSFGLLKPYYINVNDPNKGNIDIKYDDDPNMFLDRSTIIGGSGFGKGWNELKVKPGAYAKAAMRFDFGRYNESVSAFEIGISADFYSQRIPLLAMQKDRQFFYQGHIAIVFGNRK